jgi:hypothetical protein
MINIKDYLKPTFKLKIREYFSFLKFFFSLNKYSIIQDSSYKIVNLKNGINEEIYLQKVYKISSGGLINIKSNEINLITFENATLTESSDFIRLNNNKIYNPYFNYKVNKYFITTSPDYIKKKNEVYFLKNIKTNREIDTAFNLVSSNNSWSHFLALVAPKIRYISELNSNKKISIVTNFINDSQILEIINIEASKFKNVSLISLREGESIQCKTLYHIELDSYIAIHGFLSSPYGIFISKTTRDYWRGLKNKLIINNQPQTLKLFIGRKARRNMSNYNEIRDFFVEKGFLEIFPENYSLAEKARIFNSASHIVGPASSGFSNIIFCQEFTKVVWFINFSRVMDTYLPTYCEEQNISLEALTGEDEHPEDLDSNTYINLDTIKLYFNNSYFEN